MNNKIKIYFGYLLLFAVQLIVTLWFNNFNFAYPLDDTYIHLAIAKNFGIHGVWGPTPFEFASSSSSLLYTLLLSSFYFLGINSIYIPLFINIIAVFFLIQSSDKLLGIFTQQETLKYIYLILIVLFMPAIALTLSGMEHILHTVFIIYLIYYSLRVNTESNSNKDITLMFVFSILATAMRYETLFVIAGISIILLLRKKIFLSIGIVIFSLLPIIIFGVYSINQGSYFLPNTLLLKGNIQGFSTDLLINYAIVLFVRIFKYPHILISISIIIISIISIKPKSLKDNNLTLGIILLIAWFFHLVFAGVGWFYRYEAYLVVLSICYSAYLVNKYQERYFNGDFSFINLFISLRKLKISVIILLFIIIGSYSLRLGSSFYKSSLAPKNIYEQQVQMAYFTKFSESKSILLNDIGAVSYFNDITIMDLNGLGNFEIAQAIKNKQFNLDFLKNYSVSKNCELAIIYEGIHDFALPKEWIKIGSWKIKNNVICWKDVVFIYVTNSANENKFRKDFKEFSKQLPKDVEVRFY